MKRRWQCLSRVAGPHDLLVTRSFVLATQKKRHFATQAQEFDVVIVGGGMVGSSLACSLANHPLSNSLRIGLIDESKPSDLNLDKLPALPDLRVSAISPSSMRLLKEIGAWERVPAYRTAPFTAMRVWDTNNTSSLNFDGRELGEETMGCIVENNLIVDALFKRMAEHSSIRLFAPASVTTVDLPLLDEASHANQVPPESYAWADGCPWATLTLSNGSVLRTRLVVAADGKHSLVRKKAHLPTLSWVYHQKAVVASVELSTPTSTAWQRFLPSGPVALLPMYGNYGSVVWSTSPQHAHRLLHLEPEQFIHELNNAFTSPADIPDWLRQLTNGLPPILPSTPTPPEITGLPAKRASFPLSFSHATQYTRPRAVVIGDAAHTIHPLAGQGVNLGFADVTALTDVIVQAMESGSDIGDITLLRQYEQNRKWRNGAMLAGVDGLKRLYDSRLSVLCGARGLGIALIDRIPFLKKEILSFASGI